jgi:hypothetical protein
MSGSFLFPNHPLRRKTDFALVSNNLPDSACISIDPVTDDEEVELFAAWQMEEQTERAAQLRREEFRERVQHAMPKFNDADLARPTTKSAGRTEIRNERRIYAFWSELRPAQRVRLCRALALVYLDDGFSNATARDLRTSLYVQGTLNRNLYNALLILLARFSTRDLLMRLHQYSQCHELDILKLTK